MAEYYNFVTNASGTLTLEDVQRLCTVDGQSVQLVVGDINNSGNGSQQFLAYAAAPHTSEQAILSQQTNNLGSQISTTQLEQGQKVLIIKTNDISATQNILKANTVQTSSESVINVADCRAAKSSTDCNNDSRQIQWIKMHENSSNLNAVPKQSTLISEKQQTAILSKNQAQNNVQSPLSVQGHLDSQPLGPKERKPLRVFQGKNRHSTSSVQTVTPTSNSDGAVADAPTARIQRPNALNSKTPVTPFRNKVVSPLGQNVTQIIARQVRPSQLDASQARAAVPPLMSKNFLRPQHPEMEHLSERIKQAKLKQLQTQRQMQNEQRLQQNNAQRQNISGIPQQSVQNSQNSPMQRQQTVTYVTPQKQQHMTPGTQPQQVQKQQNVAQDQKCQHRQSPHPAPIQSLPSPMEIDSPEYKSPERAQSAQQSATMPSDSVSSESIAYLQKVIDNPLTTIVQHQIQGNTAKMLVMLSSGEQRLITFDIPIEECTVHDLLEQANIIFCGETIVSLVSDPELGINYIVEAGPGTVMTSFDGSDQSEGTNSQEIANSHFDNSSQAVSSQDENSNSSLSQNEEPLYIEGKYALCPHCGIGSCNFTRCERCKTRLPPDVKTIPMSVGMQQKKGNMPSVDTLYKKNNERNSAIRLEKLERDGSACKRGRGRGRGAALRSRPIHKEPECLTISSDEEEEGKMRKVDGHNSNSALSNISNAYSEDSETILEKEPVITNNSVSSTSSSYSMDSDQSVKGGTKECDGQNFSDIAQSPHTALLCRTVRIGSYKYVPRERVIISQSGVRFGVPLLEDDKNFVMLNVKFQDIVKVLIHFGKIMPVLFFYTSPSAGAMIREVLGMQDPKGPYYDPAGKDNTHKRITLLPEELTEEAKVVLKNLFKPRNLLEELNPKEANDILVRASPIDSLQLPSLGRKQSQASPSNASMNGAIQKLTVYPPPPAKGGIAINTEDYLCLGEDQFLNDVIIDFYLKYLTLEVLSETDQHRTHVFSSYFYKRLTSPHAQAGESTVPLSPAAKRHARVQKWTKNVNIFEKDFIVIPINEHAHWFLAIICFPGLVGKVPLVPAITKEDDVHKTVQKSKKLKDAKLQTVTIGSTTITPVTATITIDQVDDGSERDEAEGDDDEMEVDSDDEEEAETQENKIEQEKPNDAPPERKDIVKVPCILIFDSLAGASRSRVVATLRDYLSCEHVAKMGVEKVFSKDTIKGASPKVPQQSNFTDCGLYVLQYVESFFKDPIKDYTLPIKTLKNWFEEIVVTRKREELSKLLIKLVNATKGDKAITLPVVNFPTQDGILKPKPENQVDGKSTKPEVENKKKPTADVEARLSNNIPAVTDGAETVSEPSNRTTYQIIPFSATASDILTESSATEVLTERKIPHARSSSETMSYLKAKRIARIVSKSENQDDPQAAKKHKGESLSSCK